MKATQTCWEATLAKHIVCAPPLPPNDMNYISQGRQDVKLLKEYSIRAHKRKAVPLGTVPCEILAQILAPNYRKPSRTGVRLQGETVGSCKYEEPIQFIPSQEHATGNTEHQITGNNSQRTEDQYSEKRATSSSKNDVTSYDSETSAEPCLATSTADRSDHQTASSHRNDTWGNPNALHSIN